MCNWIERRKVKGTVIVSMEQCQTDRGDRAFIPKMINPDEERLYRYPDWIKGFKVRTPKGEDLFIPLGSTIEVAT